MSSPDDRLRAALEHLAAPAQPNDDLLEQIIDRRRHVRLARRVGTASLAIAVVALTVGATWGLARVFRAEPSVLPAGPEGGLTGRIAFVSDRTGNDDIFVMDASDPSRTVNVTNDPASDLMPAWSPDGSALAFVSNRTGRPELYVMRADGSGVRQLTLSTSTDDFFPTAPAWSPDGSSIAVSTPVGGRPTRIWILSLQTGSSVSPEQQGQPLFNSPPQPRSAAERNPTWSPDSGQIAFEQGAAADQSTTTPTTTIVVSDTTGTISSFGPEAATDPAWSPTGGAIAFVRGGGIEAMAPDGSGVRTVYLDALRTANSPGWSPDGRHLVFSQQRAANADLYVVPAEGGGPIVRLTEAASFEGSPAWGPSATLPSVPATPTQASPDASSPPTLPSQTAEPAPTPSSASPVVPDCVSSSVNGDFDGDGMVDDTASIACSPEAPDASPPETRVWGIEVHWPPSGGAWALPECAEVCRALAAYDLDGDGTDELVVVVREAEGIQFLGVYALRVSEIGPQVIGIAPPGSDGFPADQPASLPFGISESGLDSEYVTCSTGSDGSPLVHQISSVLSQDMRELTTRETVLTLASDEFSTPSAFEVVSSDTQVHEDPGVPGQAEPADVACWAE